MQEELSIKHQEMAQKVSQIAVVNIIPLNDDKSPKGAWKQYQTESIKDITPSSHYGLVCGFSNVEVIDIDLKVLDENKRQEYWNSMLKEIKNNIENFENKLAIYRTQNSGYHIIYKSQDLQSNTVIAKNNHGKALVETRGKGGYAMMYFDKHECGLTYEGLTQISSDDRDTLFTIFYGYNEYEETLSPIKMDIPKYNGYDFTPWDDFNSQHDVMDIIRDEFSVVRDTKKGTRIKLNGAKSESSGIIFKDTGLLYIHSTSTSYPENVALSAYHLYTLKNFGGDFKASTKELTNKGYGCKSINNASEEKISTMLQNKAKRDGLSDSVKESIVYHFKEKGVSQDEFKVTASNYNISDMDVNYCYRTDTATGEVKDLLEIASDVFCHKGYILTDKIKSKKLGDAREFLSNNFYRVIHSDLFFCKNPDGSPNFLKSHKLEDLFMDLKDGGMRFSKSDFDVILKTDKIKVLTPLDIFFTQLKVNKWDEKDRIKPLIKAMNLSGDFDDNYKLIKKWFCCTYATALWDIDNEINFRVFPRVVFILISAQRGFGKTEFFRKIGLDQKISEQFQINNCEIYSELSGELTKDERLFDNQLFKSLILMIDDIDNLFRNSGGVLRSITTKKSIDYRPLYTNSVETRRRTASLAGTSNMIKVLRDKDENRYMPFTIEKQMDFEALNEIDIIQFWAQIRALTIESEEASMFTNEEYELIIERAQSYIYNTDEEDTLADLFEYDSEKGLTSEEINGILVQHQITIHQNKFKKIFARIIPPGADVTFRKSIGSSKKTLYRVKYRK